MPAVGINNGLATDGNFVQNTSNKSSFLKLTSFILNANETKASITAISNENESSPKHSLLMSPESINVVDSYNNSKLDVLLNGNGDITIDNSDNSKLTASNSDGIKYSPLIKTSHWKDATKARCCDCCLKDFRFGSKKHNCRRCGNVFCVTCCQYRKRLSPEANPDPQGNVYRVCITCADLHIQETGVTQSLSNAFFDHRKNKRLLIENDLNRLLNGFEENVDPNSPLKSAIELLPSFRMPDWQKGANFISASEVDWCSKCTAKFTLLSRKLHCRICGYVYCSKCCKMSLLLYYDENRDPHAKLIGVVGCPDKEPPISLYLNICNACEENLEEYQVHQFYLQNAKSSHINNSKMKDLEDILEKLNKIEKKIKELLPSFQEQLDTYIFEDNPNKNLDGQDNMEVFAKAHADISDLFTRYSTIIQGLKQINMTSQIEIKLMQNITSVKCNQYNSEMNTFKCLKYTMNKNFPAKSLEQFQRFANTHAINNTYIMTRQLGLEALNLSLKYRFDTDLAERLSEADQICFSELQDYLQSIDENQKEHIDVLNDLLKVQLKEKTLVMVDKKDADIHGNAYVISFLVQRCCTILYQILKALKSKSSETQFSKSKEVLQILLDFVLDQKQGENRL